ncbi:hypothetical protein Salat_2105000 [Sesamum alatum]|uniref:Uncharacterized protein n=1 Tax=Sesamum alatum TaxID=300844 RepID=A0AAE1Y1L3_9LAMI|nr:hypothetical protein Salat_2105000 [Sesamum alatum]
MEHISPTFSPHFNAAAFTLIYSQLINSFHQGIMFIVPTLIQFLQCKYQGSENSPFVAHPYTTLVAVGTSLAYFVAFSAIRLSPAPVVKHCVVWSGNASVASLASMLFPNSVRPLLWFMCVVLSAPDELLRWLYKRVVEGSKELNGRYQVMLLLFQRREGKVHDYSEILWNSDSYYGIDTTVFIGFGQENKDFLLSVVRCGSAYHW